MFIKDENGVIAESKERNNSFNVKIKVKLEGKTNMDSNEVGKNIQLRFINSRRFTGWSLGKVASYLDDDQCKKLTREFYKRGF